MLVLLLPAPACAVNVGAGTSSDSGQAEAKDPEQTPALDPEEPDAKPARATPSNDEAAELPDCPGADDETYCTEDNKLAGQWVPVDMLRIPADAEQLFHAPHPDVDRQPSLTIAVNGETLYLHQVSCGACARVIGQGFRGELSALSEAQLAAVQARLGLPADTAPLRSAEMWGGYVTGEGASVLAELSLLSER